MESVIARVQIRSATLRKTCWVGEMCESIAGPPTGDARRLGAELDGFGVVQIEDDALGSAALKAVLTAWGCDVTTAGDAASACALWPSLPAVDFIVSDYRLPGPHTGIDAIRMLRDRAGCEVAACVITGDPDGVVREQAQQAALVMMQKPVCPAKLRSLLRHAVQKNVNLSQCN